MMADGSAYYVKLSLKTILRPVVHTRAAFLLVDDGVGKRSMSSTRQV
jgi:hypothetical protein